MRWTHDTPTVEGYYWLVGRYEGVKSSEEPEVVRVMTYGPHLRSELYVLWPGSDWDEEIGDVPETAWWMGPLPTPAPPPVAND